MVCEQVLDKLAKLDQFGRTASTAAVWPPASQVLCVHAMLLCQCQVRSTQRCTDKDCIAPKAKKASNGSRTHGNGQATQDGACSRLCLWVQRSACNRAGAAATGRAAPSGPFLAGRARVQASRTTHLLCCSADWSLQCMIGPPWCARRSRKLPLLWCCFCCCEAELFLAFDAAAGLPLSRIALSSCDALCTGPAKPRSK